MHTGQTIGARLRSLREARGLRLIDVAPHLGTDTGSISRIERGQRDPSLAQLRSFAELYRVTVVSMLRGIDAPSSKRRVA